MDGGRRGEKAYLFFSFAYSSWIIGFISNKVGFFMRDPGGFFMGTGWWASNSIF